MVCHQASLVLMAFILGSQVYSNKPFIFWKDNAIQYFFEHVEILQSQGKYFATQFAKSRG